MNAFVTHFLRFEPIVLLTLLSVSGCSGSDSAETSLVNDESDSNGITIVDNTVSDSAITNDEATGQTSDIVSEQASDLDAPTIEPESPDVVDQSDTSTSTEELTASTIPVTFDIDVPVYSSNALQVRVVWGETDTTAAWVANESWTVTTNLSTNTEYPLRSVFSTHY